jgi:hypothetical protein
MVFGDCFVDSMLTTTAIGRRQLQGRDAETLVDILMRVVVSSGVNLQWWAATPYRLLLLKTDLVFIQLDIFDMILDWLPPARLSNTTTTQSYHSNDIIVIVFGPQTTITYFEVLRYVASSRKQQTIAKSCQNLI